MTTRKDLISLFEANIAANNAMRETLRLQNLDLQQNLDALLAGKKSSSTKELSAVLPNSGIPMPPPSNVSPPAPPAPPSNVSPPAPPASPSLEKSGRGRKSNEYYLEKLNSAFEQSLSTQDTSHFYDVYSSMSETSRDKHYNAWFASLTPEKQESFTKLFS